MDLAAYLQTWEVGALQLETITPEDLHRFHEVWSEFWLIGFVANSSLLLNCRVNASQQIVLINKQQPAVDGIGILQLKLPPGFLCLATIESQFDNSSWMVSTKPASYDYTMPHLPVSHGWEREHVAMTAGNLSEQAFGQAILALVGAIIIAVVLLFFAYDFYINRRCCHSVTPPAAAGSSGPQEDFQEVALHALGLPVAPPRRRAQALEMAPLRVPPNHPQLETRELRKAGSAPALVTFEDIDLD